MFLSKSLPRSFAATAISRKIRRRALGKYFPGSKGTVRIWSSPGQRLMPEDTAWPSGGGGLSSLPLGFLPSPPCYKKKTGVDQYRKTAFIVECADLVTGMEDAVQKMVRLGKKVLQGEKIVFPKAEGCFEQGLRKNYFHAEPAYRRAIALLLQKIGGDSFETEYPIPFFDRVDPQAAIGDLKGLTIALVTSGGIVPTGNPDHIESSNASKYGRYSLEGLEKLETKTHQSAHGGYDNTYANHDPNRVLPIDMMRELEKELGFKQHEWYYATVGNGTSVDSAQKFAKEIAVELIRDGVQAVILTST